jgi:phosphatidylserine/phosphatidylglycerophosphate/cardiolipin synthase-like enzyme
MRLIRPNREELTALFDKRVRSIWVCSPWISTAGSELLRVCLGRCDLSTLLSFELWTRLDSNDYRFGFSDYPAVNRLLEQIRGQAQKTQISIWAAPNLHAKIVWTEVGALVGSANLTSAGFTTNVEAAVRLESEECKQQSSVREVWRQGLSEVSTQQWNSFLSGLSSKDTGGTATNVPISPDILPDSGTWDDLLRQLLSDGFPFDRGIR